MNEERTPVLQMLANGKVTVDEAMSLLEALERNDRSDQEARQPFTRNPAKPSRREQDMLIDQVLRLRTHDVDARYIAAMKEIGFDNLTADQLIHMRTHDVSPQFVQEIRNAGFPDVTPEELLQMAIHGVDTSFIHEMREATSRDLSVRQLVKLRIHDVDAEVFSEIMSLGLIDADSYAKEKSAHH